MTDYDTPGLKDIAQKPVVGVDSTGAVHYFCTVRQTVFVVDGDTLQHTEDIGECTLTKWIAYVRDKRGWREMRYVDGGLGALVAATMEVA